MRITLAAVGSRGDVQPYIALGRGLQAHGHQVRVATHAAYAPLVRDHGLDFHLVSGDPNETLRSSTGQGLQASAGNPLRYIQRLREIADALMLQITRDCWEASQDADLVLTTILGVYPIYSILEKRGIPGGLAYMQPATTTRAFPHYQFPPAPPWLPTPGLYNRVTYEVMRQLFWRMLRSSINTARRTVLALPPLALRPALAHTARMLHLYGYSSQVVPRPADWPAQDQVTGYWFLDPPPTWEPPPAVRAFLAAGPPPVYVGFGSMRAADPAAEVALIVAALAQAGQRGVVLAPGGISPAAVPATVLLIEDIPHAWLFPQVAAVVHHGGAGTTAAGLRAGRPTVVVPFFTDQPFWGRRVHALGVGPPPLPHKQLTVAGLAAAIRQAVSDPLIAARAATLGTRLQAEDGITTAVTALDGYLSAGPPRAVRHVSLIKETVHAK